MRIIDVPKEVAVIKKIEPDKVTMELKDREYGFTEFCQAAIDGHKFGPGYAGAQKALRLTKLVGKAEAGKAFQLEDADHDLLKGIVNACEYLTPFAIPCIPYFEAIEKAQPVEVPTGK